MLGELSLLWEVNIGSKTGAAGHPASQAPGGGHNGAEAKGGTTEDEHSSSTLIDNIGLSLEVHLNAYAGAVEIFDKVSNEFMGFVHRFRERLPGFLNTLLKRAPGILRILQVCQQFVYNSFFMICVNTSNEQCNAAPCTK